MLPAARMTMSTMVLLSCSLFPNLAANNKITEALSADSACCSAPNSLSGHYHKLKWILLFKNWPLASLACRIAKPFVLVGTRYSTYVQDSNYLPANVLCYNFKQTNPWWQWEDLVSSDHSAYSRWYHACHLITLSFSTGSLFSNFSSLSRLF